MNKQTHIYLDLQLVTELLACLASFSYFEGYDVISTISVIAITPTPSRLRFTI